MDHELAKFIKTGKMDIDEALHQRGIKKLSQLSFDLLNQGITSIEEAYPLLINQ
jgi:type IV pilus assembly protein PilB